MEVGGRVRVAVSFSREREREKGGVRPERQPIRLGDDSPTPGIYSIRTEGGSDGANGTGGGQHSIIAPPTGSGGERDRHRRNEECQGGEGEREVGKQAKWRIGGGGGKGR